jgi:peptidoglycan/LPS O-acetylase OafA/YrhL
MHEPTWLRRTDHLLILRGVAALDVIAYHAQDAYRATLPSLASAGQNFSWLLTANGAMAVRIFFVLSGFLMFKAFYTRRYLLTRGGVWSFYRARWLRIAPLYYFLCLVFVVLVYPALLQPEQWGTLLSLATFTYSGATPPAFANAFWSLSTEMEFYLLVPLLVAGSMRLISERWHLFAAYVVIPCSGIALRLLGQHWPVSAASNLLLNLDAFLMGGLTAVLIGVTKARPNISAWSIPIAGVILFAFIHWAASGPSSAAGRAAIPAVVAVGAACFIWLSESVTGGSFIKATYRLRSVARNPALWPAYLGALSYGIYLWHQPILYHVQYSGLLPHHGWKTLAAEYVLTVMLVGACAIWTHRYIERDQSR